MSDREKLVIECGSRGDRNRDETRRAKGRGKDREKERKNRGKPKGSQMYLQSVVEKIKEVTEKKVKSCPAKAGPEGKRGKTRTVKLAFE